MPLTINMLRAVNISLLTFLSHEEMMRNLLGNRVIRDDLCADLVFDNVFEYYALNRVKSSAPVSDGLPIYFR